ncbi:MAG: 2-oxoglutarate oxidoreductase, partial [Anaerolineales bacterium]|nr:2-oxoglutarate oxidoreductase [Anaerolineales bacterium]
MATLTTEQTEKLVYQRPDTLAETYTHYCPGCTHGTAHRLVAEVLSELGMQDNAILVASVGCSVFSYKYFDVDAAEAAHGRACAMATGIKRVNPNNIVFTYQGDG